MSKDDQWLTKKQAAEISGLSTKSLERAIRRGRLRKAENGVRRVLIAYSELMRWMKGERMPGM